MKATHNLHITPEANIMHLTKNKIHVHLIKIMISNSTLTQKKININQPYLKVEKNSEKNQSHTKITTQDTK